MGAVVGGEVDPLPGGGQPMDLGRARAGEDVPEPECARLGAVAHPQLLACNPIGSGEDELAACRGPSPGREAPGLNDAGAGPGEDVPDSPGVDAVTRPELAARGAVVGGEEDTVAHPDEPVGAGGGRSQGDVRH